MKGRTGDEEKKMSVLLKFYIRKVFSKIKSPALQKRYPSVKTEKAGSKNQDDKKKP